MKYRDYNGNTGEISELSHSHLSNIYWFNKILNGWDDYDSRLNSILDSIKQKFGGEILPYNPKWQFKTEIETLESRGHFIWNLDKTRADIVYMGKVVGSYETPESIRNEKITDLLT